MISRRSHRSISTAAPNVKKIIMPLILLPRLHARQTPVAMSHIHHSGENSLQALRATFQSRVEMKLTCSEAF